MFTEKWYIWDSLHQSPLADNEGEVGRDMEETRVAICSRLQRVGVEYTGVHRASLSTCVFF